MQNGGVLYSGTSGVQRLLGKEAAPDHVACCIANLVAHVSRSTPPLPERRGLPLDKTASNRAHKTEQARGSRRTLLPRWYTSSLPGWANQQVETYLPVSDRENIGNRLVDLGLPPSENSDSMDGDVDSERSRNRLWLPLALQRQRTKRKTKQEHKREEWEGAG